MTDGGSSDTENDVAHRDLRAETKVLIRSRALLALLRGQLRLLEQALLDHSPQAIGEPPPTVIQRLESIRLTTERLGHAMRSPALEVKPAPTVSPPPHTEAPPPATSAAPGGATARHSVRIDLRYAHLRALVESGALAAWDIGHAGRVQEVVQHMLDRWSSLYASNIKKGVHIMPTSDRRTSHDRRMASSSPAGVLLGAGPRPFVERRNGLDRRRAPMRQQTDRDGAGAPVPPHSEAVRSRNVVSLVEARVPRNRARPQRRGTRVGGPDVVAFPAQPESLTRRSAPEHVDTVDGQRGPDTREGHQDRWRERLVIDGDREEKLTGGRDVLKQPDGGEPKTPGGGDKQDEG